MQKQNKRNGRLVELSVQSIRDRILDLTLEPGSHINDKWLMETFNLSRTPMREALNRLTAEGLVDIIPNRGAFVRKLDLSEIEQLFGAFRMSERAAAYYCDFTDANLISEIAEMQAKHRQAIKDGRFLDVTYWFATTRSRVAASCGNRYIFEFCERMNNRMRRLNYFVYLIESRAPGFCEKQFELAVCLHGDVQDALKRADRERLVEVMGAQVTVLRERVARALSQDQLGDLPLEGLSRETKDAS